MGHEPETTLSRECLSKLSGRVFMTAEDALICLEVTDISTLRPNTVLLGAIELAMLTTRARNFDLVTEEQAVEMLRAVTELFMKLPEETVELWLSGRDSSDLAIQRDFLALKLSASEEKAKEIDELLFSFRDFIAKKIEKPQFDIFSDAVMDRSQIYLNVKIQDLTK